MSSIFDIIIEGIFIPANPEEVKQRKINYLRIKNEEDRIRLETERIENAEKAAEEKIKNEESITKNIAFKESIEKKIRYVKD